MRKEGGVTAVEFITVVSTVIVSVAVLVRREARAREASEHATSAVWRGRGNEEIQIIIMIMYIIKVNNN